MDFGQFAAFVEYLSVFAIGLIIGRLTMAVQYAIMKPK